MIILSYEAIRLEGLPLLKSSTTYRLNLFSLIGTINILSVCFVLTYYVDLFYL